MKHKTTIENTTTSSDSR